MLDQYCPSCGSSARRSDTFCRGCGCARSDAARAAGPIAEAESLVERGKLDGAISTLQRALGEAETPESHVALCTLYLRRGDATRARHALDRAIILDPDCAVAHAYLAGMDLHAGRVADAEGRLDHARDLAPDDLIVRIKRAEYWLRLGIFDNARAELRHALQNCGGSPQNRAIAEAMFASVEKRSRGSFTRKTVALPSLGAAKNLFRHWAARNGARAEAEA